MTEADHILSIYLFTHHLNNRRNTFRDDSVVKQTINAAGQRGCRNRL